MSTPEVAPLAEQFEKLRRTGLCFDLSARTRLQMTGDDRVKFLHNLSTAEIKKLPPGQGCETFIPTLQGKILGHFFALPTTDSIYLTGVPNQVEALLPHFQKYAVIEDVEVVDRTSDTQEFLLVGEPMEKLIAESWSITPPQSPLEVVELDHPSFPQGTILYRTTYVDQPAWGLITSGDPLPSLSSDDQAMGSDEALEALRVEAGFPFYGRDLTIDNLCQEAARDALAISFTKGCYLGQETIARIDALGHVNRRLLGVKFAAEPSPDAVYEVDGKPALQVTSTTYSPSLNRWIGLAMVRRGFDKPGQTLETSSGPVEIAPLSFSA
ncbi:CAF17-like 4Fe-4S cluster assembly/insertion protein YgfZ [Blastopirellula retiformator]|uniref:Aminomethyltransferase n=1 Tax=Blastopirellula retiformator TaxID=2527970 RepID=A0A5C5UYQ1_9BACT|nr:glycine cleavage T C-terminal barrel domain-containing protein [Blastopirellula retiformator]TWT30585.1 Aminomethyltransferase [Blastopirellula retiformator]